MPVIDTSRIATGLDRLLGRPGRLAGRRWALLAHGASLAWLDARARPAHLALAGAGSPPAFLVAPEHGYYGVEQDMAPAASEPDPLTGIPIVSLYGDSEASLRPDPGVFADVDLLVVDYQDVGTRYYTYAATAVWAAEAAVAAGCEVWALDRPNPLGGEGIEGERLHPGYESFVGAFEIPVRHGLTAAELVLRAARLGGWAEALTTWEMEGWRRSMAWPETGRPFLAPSPNLPTYEVAVVYPGGCLVEATAVSEGRGTTRPFLLVGAPGIEPRRLADALVALGHPGVRFVPTLFKPQFQKHAGRVCGGVELVVTDPARLPAYRLGIDLVTLLHDRFPDSFRWRDEPYEFVADRPAIDLLTGSAAYREALEGGGRDAVREWVEGWRPDEARFREERRDWLLYPEEPA